MTDASYCLSRGSSLILFSVWHMDSFERKTHLITPHGPGYELEVMEERI